MIEPMYTADEAATIQKVSVIKIRRDAGKGLYPGAYRIGGVRGPWVFPESTLQAHRTEMARRAEQAEQPVSDLSALPDDFLLRAQMRLAPRSPKAEAAAQRRNLQVVGG